MVDKTTLSYILAEISASNSKFGSATLIPILSSCASITNRLVSNATSFAKVETSVVSPVTVNVPEISRSFENWTSTAEILAALILPLNVEVPFTCKLPRVVFDATFIVWNEVEPSTPILIVVLSAVVATSKDSPDPGIPLTDALPPIPECPVQK